MSTRRPSQGSPRRSERQTVVFRIRPTQVTYGLAGAPDSMHTLTTEEMWPSSLVGFEKQHLANVALNLISVLSKAYDGVLVAAVHSHVVVVEDPLVAVPIKKVMAQVLLGELRALSLAFIPSSVCITIASGLESAIVVLENYQGAVVVPVAHYQELSALLRTTTCREWSCVSKELDDDELDISTIVQKLSAEIGYDARGSVHGNVLSEVGAPGHTDMAWLGACLAVPRLDLGMVLLRSNYLRGNELVPDPLLGWV